MSAPAGRLAAALPRIELGIELARIDLGYRAAMAMEIEHIRPDTVRDLADVAVRIARQRQARAGRQRPVSIVYLLHFAEPYKHARHYLGWTDDLPARLARHQAGQGARLLEVIHAAGITWELARTWEGPRARERQIKRQGGAAVLCPLCGFPRRHRVARSVPAIAGGAR